MFLDRFDVLICPRGKTAPATAVVLKTDWVIKQRVNWQVIGQPACLTRNYLS